MGRPRVKTIDSAVDVEKAEKVKQEETKLSKEAEEKVEKQVKEAKKTIAKKYLPVGKVGKKQRTRSKRYEEISTKIDKTKEYPVAEAIDIIKKASQQKFDSSVEIHINLNTDHTKSDQFIRKSINLPHSSGKTLRVLVFGGNSAELKKLGFAVGTDATLKKIDEGKIDVDKVVASPDWMPKLTKSAKILGPKGLMPNPKSGTITDKPEEIAKNLQGGMIEIKTEKAAIIHTTIGKVSALSEKLEENLKALVKEIRSSKPESLKKELIKSVFLSSTMSPSVRVDLSSLS